MCHGIIFANTLTQNTNMKKTGIIILLYSTVLYSCNNGGNSSVPAYTTTKNDTASSTSSNNTTVLAPTEAGKELFQARCATCHGLDGNARNNNAGLTEDCKG